MSNDTKARPAKPPEKRIGPFASGIGVAIWLNEVTAEDGSVRRYRSVTLNPRRYFDQKSGQWKDSASYQQSDLLRFRRPPLGSVFRNEKELVAQRVTSSQRTLSAFPRFAQFPQNMASYQAFCDRLVTRFGKQH